MYLCPRFFYTIILSLLGDLIVSVVDGQTLGIDIIQIEAIEDDPLLNLVIETCILGRNIDDNKTCAGGESSRSSTASFCHELLNSSPNCKRFLFLGVLGLK